MIRSSVAGLVWALVFVLPVHALDLNVPEKIVLKNGLRIIVKTDHSIPHVAMTLAVLAGSSQEAPLTAGASRILAALWSDPDEWMPDTACRARLEASIAAISARNDPLLLLSTVEVPSDRLKDGLTLLSSNLSLRTVSATALSRAQQVAVNERQARADNPRAQRVLSELLASSVYGKHPLGTPRGGRGENALQLSLKQLEVFADQCLTPSRSCVAIVGDTSLADILKLAPEAFPQAATPVRVTGVIPPAPLNTTAVDEVAYGSVDTAIGLVGFRVPGVSDHDYTALLLLSRYLAAGRGSVLHRRLVQREAQLSELSTQLTDYPVENLLTFELVSTTDEARGAARAVLEEAARIGRQGVDSATLEVIKSGAKANHALDRQTLIGQAVALARGEEVSSIDVEVDFATRVDRVTADDIQRVSARYLLPGFGQFVEMRPRSAKGADQQTVLTTKLPDGPTVVVHRDFSTEVVGIAVQIPGGLYLDPVEKPGLSSLLEDALTAGVTSVEAPETTMVRMDGAGAQIHPLKLLLSNSAARDGVALTINATLYSFDDLLETFHNVLFWPRFEEVDVERAKERQLARWRDIAQNPSDNGDWEMASILYPDGEYSRSIDRLLEQVPHYTVADLKEQHARLVGMGRTVVAITGNVAPPRVVAKVAEVFSGSPRRAGIDPVEREPSYAFEPLTEMKKETRVSNKSYDTVWLGFKLPHDAYKDITALTVWWMLLSQGKDAVLREGVRKVDPSATLIRASLSPRRFGLDLMFGFRVGHGRGEAVAEVLVSEIYTLGRLPLTKEMIEKTHRQIQNAVSMQFQDKVGQAMKLAFATFVLDEPDLYERTLGSYAALTTQELVRVRDSYLKFGQLLIYKGR